MVGTDNWELLARAARPPLTTVDMDLAGVGRRAAECLLAAIEGEPRHGRIVVPAPRLVVRASTGLPYTDPEASAPRHYHDFCLHPTALSREPAVWVRGLGVSRRG